MVYLDCQIGKSSSVTHSRGNRRRERQMGSRLSSEGGVEVHEETGLSISQMELSHQFRRRGVAVDD